MINSGQQQLKIELSNGLIYPPERDALLIVNKLTELKIYNVLFLAPGEIVKAGQKVRLSGLVNAKI